MNEKTLCSALMKTLRTDLRGAVVIKHADRVTSGVPDISVTWGGRTTWLEVKYLRKGGRIELGIQHRTCERLALNGSCRYVVYQEIPKITVLVPPEDLQHLLNSNMTRSYGVGFNHSMVVDYIRELHVRS